MIPRYILDPTIQEIIDELTRTRSCSARLAKLDTKFPTSKMASFYAIDAPHAKQKRPRTSVTTTAIGVVPKSILVI